MFWILATIALAALVYYFAIKPNYYWTSKGIKQGRIVPFFGDNWVTIVGKGSLGDMVQKMYNKFSNVRYLGTFLGQTAVLTLKDPELIKQITVKDFDHFLDHRNFLPDNEVLWSKNLFVLKGQKWRDMRTTLSPSFTSSKMKAMFVLMIESAENFIKYYLERDEPVISMDIKDVCTRYTNDVIATTAFGITVNSIENRENDFYLMGKEITSFTGFWKTLKLSIMFMSPGLTKLFNLKFFNEKTSSFFYNLVTSSIKYREEHNVVRPDMIHLLMEAKKGNTTSEKNDHTDLSDTIDPTFAPDSPNYKLLSDPNSKTEITDMDIVSQALIFFFAGFDSVATLMCFMAFELALNTDVQEKLIQEIDEVREHEKSLTYESLMKMKYMDMVVCESLRKWPNAVASDRVCTKPYTIEPKLPGEVPIYLDVGTFIWIPTYAIHRDPKYFPNPEKFDPERFSAENKSKIAPYTYIPFGAGPRICIGSRFAILETKALFFYILSHFEIVPVKETVTPLRLSKKHMQMTAEGGFRLGLKKRQLK